MPVRITNKQQVAQPLPDPINRVLKPFEVVTYPLVECDKLLNDIRYVNLIVKQLIIVECLLNESTDYVSEWNQEPKLRLGNYVFWVDALGLMRIKSGDPLSDFDGIEVGAGAVGPHGTTHIFNGPDPIPRIEVLEGSWNCTATEAIRDVVYEIASGTAARADGTSLATMPARGIIISKPTLTSCTIARSGEVTGFVGLTPDIPYFAGLVPGGITATQPSAPGQVLQKIGYSKDSTTLVIELGTYVVRS